MACVCFGRSDGGACDLPGTDPLVASSAEERSWSTFLVANGNGELRGIYRTRYPSLALLEAGIEDVRIIWLIVLPRT